MSACDVCKGACCEQIVMPVNWLSLPPDVARWVRFHGKPMDGGILVDQPCWKLRDGKCSIYSNRPNVCRQYPVGGEDCRRAIRERRGNDPAILELLP